MSEEFVTIELSKKQVDFSSPYHNEKTGKDYGRVMAPGGGSFLYPLDSIKIKKDDPERVYFSRPVGTEIQVQYSHKRDDAPAGTPNEDLYINSTRIWKIEDLKAAYDDERKEYFEKNSSFVNMMVPTDWGRVFASEGKGNFVSIAIPIDNKYYSFVVPEERFKKSERNEGMSYFGFPRKKKDSDEDYRISLKRSIELEDGTYQTIEIMMTSAELKEKVDAAVDYNELKNMFVSTEISDKLIRHFSSNEGKALCGISVPIMEQDVNGKTSEAFYEIIVPAERVKALEHEKSRLSLFKNGSDGTAYTFTGKKSVKNEKGEYEKFDLKLTSEEIIKAFESSREIYKNIHETRSLADELKSSATANSDQTVHASQNPFLKKPHGR